MNFNVQDHDDVTAILERELFSFVPKNAKNDKLLRNLAHLVLAVAGERVDGIVKAAEKQTEAAYALETNLRKQMQSREEYAHRTAILAERYRRALIELASVEIAKI